MQLFKLIKIKEFEEKTIKIIKNENGKILKT